MVQMNEMPDPSARALRPWRRSGTDSALVHVEVDALSHVGRHRSANEDHYLVARLDRSLSTLVTNLPADSLPAEHTATAYAMIVADGMGGAVAGEVASREAIRGLVDLAVETPDWIMRLDDRSVPEVLRRFGERFRSLKEALVERAKDDPDLSGMGTTLTVACSLGADLILAHAGDSRAYLLRNGRLWQLTRDHTIAQALADSGAIRPDEVAGHPMAHMLTNAIGTQAGGVRVELHHTVLTDGDRLLLCTDGLTDAVGDEAIAGALLATGSASDACRRLVDVALAGDCRDNVTAIVAHFRMTGQASNENGT
jgi:serine/threonine protein phosphatase PrpC